MTDEPIARNQGLHREPPMPEPDALARLGAKVLEPVEALRLVGPPPQRTAYVADRLLLRRDRVAEVLPLLEKVASSYGWAVELDEGQEPWEASLTRLRIAALEQATRAPDAWLLYQSAAAQERLDGVCLDHVMVPSLPFTESSPIDPFLPFTESSPVAAGYARPGQGGLEPVALLMGPPPRPARRPASRSARRPVVAIIDSGCFAEHPWLSGAVRTDVEVNGVVPGHTDPSTDPERHPSQRGRINGVRDRYAGHGTFIAGVIRQVCPDASVVSWRVVPSDGPVAESDLVDVLDAVATLAEQYAASPTQGHPIDVLSLSLGYYPEWDPASVAYDLAITWALERLRSAGVLVVCAAGNDATTRPRMPAALSEATSPLPQLLSVGALNVDRVSDALFSNAGSWVSDHRVGASVVSTLPPFDTSEQAAVATTFDGRRRSGPDAGCFAVPGVKEAQGGFGVWSGTSFAAPVLAAELACALAQTGFPDHEPQEKRLARLGDVAKQVTGRG